jgi:hypothetical protein
MAERPNTRTSPTSALGALRIEIGLEEELDRACYEWMDKETDRGREDFGGAYMGCFSINELSLGLV